MFQVEVAVLNLRSDHEHLDVAQQDNLQSPHRLIQFIQKRFESSWKTRS